MFLELLQTASRMRKEKHDQDDEMIKYLSQHIESYVSNAKLILTVAAQEGDDEKIIPVDEYIWHIIRGKLQSIQVLACKYVASEFQKAIEVPSFVSSYYEPEFQGRYHCNIRFTWGKSKIDCISST